MNELWTWIAQNWVALGVALWLFEQALRAISVITPWKFDDNLVEWLAGILKAVFPKKVT